MVVHVVDFVGSWCWYCWCRCCWYGVVTDVAGFVVVGGGFIGCAGVGTGVVSAAAGVVVGVGSVVVGSAVVVCAGVGGLVTVTIVYVICSTFITHYSRGTNNTSGTIKIFESEERNVKLTYLCQCN